MKLVHNTHGGTATASAFSIHVTQNGVDVSGSPMTGMDGVGRTYTLPAGTYTLAEDPAAGYRGIWSGVISGGGTVVLNAGQELTVTRTNLDMSMGTTIVPIPAETTPSTTPTTPTTPTTTGGTLPNTSTPIGNLLLLGAGLVAVGAVGFRSRKLLMN